MIDWVSIVRHSRRRFSNYAPNLRRLRPPKNPSSSHKTDKEHRNKYHHNNHNCSSTANSPTDSETTKSNALSCCYCHVWNCLFYYFYQNIYKCHVPLICTLKRIRIWGRKKNKRKVLLQSYEWHETRKFNIYKKFFWFPVKIVCCLYFLRDDDEYPFIYIVCRGDEKLLEFPFNKNNKYFLFIEVLCDFLS